MKKKESPIKVGEEPRVRKSQAAGAILLNVTTKQHQRELKKVGKATLNHTSF